MGPAWIWGPGKSRVVLPYWYLVSRLYRKDERTSGTESSQLLNIIVPCSLLLLAFCFCFAYILFYVSGLSLCIMTWGGQHGTVGPTTKPSWCSPISFLWELNPAVHRIFLSWNSNAKGEGKTFVYFVCMNGSLPVSFVANMKLCKTVSGLIKCINVCSHCMFISDCVLNVWILWSIYSGYILKIYKVFDIVKTSTTK